VKIRLTLIADRSISCIVHRWQTLTLESFGPSYKVRNKPIGVGQFFCGNEKAPFSLTIEGVEKKEL